MKDNILIPVAIITTLLVGALNVFLHFMPYSAPTVLLMLFIGGYEMSAGYKKNFANRRNHAKR